MNIQINRWKALLLVVLVLFFSLFSLLGMSQHWGYLTSINDLGSFDQVAWMASQGNLLVNTSIFDIPMNWLGFHYQPILFAFASLYKIIPTVNWFIFAQSGALAISAWPIFLIAERVTNSGKAAFAWSMAYLCNPFLLNAAAWDFHPVSIAVPLLALGLLAVQRKQIMLLVVVTVMLLACKEHMGLAVAGLGLLYGAWNRAWVVGLSLFMAGIAAFILIIAVIMPSYSLTGQHLMFSENVGQLGRYSWLGGNPAEVIKKVVLEPIAVIRAIVTMGGVNYLLLLLTPFLFMSLGGMLWILPAIADLLVNSLSANQMPRNIFSYHSVTLIPILAVAAIYGSCKFARPMKTFNAVKLSYLVMLISLILGYVFTPLPLYGSANYWKVNRLVTTNDPTVLFIRTLISNGSVSAQSNIGSHFSQRKEIYHYPQKVGEADFIILRLKSPTQRLHPFDKKIVATLAYHLLMNPFDYLNSISDLLIKTEYGIALWQDPWLVLEKGKASEANVSDVLHKIEMLRGEWLGSISE